MNETSSHQKSAKKSVSSEAAMLVLPARNRCVPSFKISLNEVREHQSSMHGQMPCRDLTMRACCTHPASGHPANSTRAKEDQALKHRRMSHRNGLNGARSMLLDVNNNLRTDSFLKSLLGSNHKQAGIGVQSSSEKDSNVH